MARARASAFPARFVTSAFVTVYEHATASAANIDRYKEYKRAIERLGGRTTASGTSSLISLVWKMEHLALEELKDFCRDQRYGSFIF